MAIRHLVAALILAFIIGKTLRKPRFGVLAFVVILFLDPSNLFWGFDQWHIPLIISIAILAATLTHARERNKNLGGGAIFFWVFALTLFLSISTMNSFDIERSYPILVDYWLKTFVFCWLLMAWTKSEDDLRLFFTVLVGSFVLLALRAIYRYTAGYAEIAGLAGTMLDRNDFALHLMMIVPIAHALAENARSRWAKQAYMASTALIFICVMLTYSRMGFVLMLAAGLMLFWFSRHKLRIVQIFVPVVIAFIVVLPQSYVERIESIWTYQEDASAMGRITAWGAGVAVGKEHPLTGIGLKCFELPEVYFKYAEGIPHVVHNAYIQLLAETGIPALISWLLLMLSGVFGAWALARSNISGEMRSYARAIAFSIVLYLLGSIFLNSAYFELPYIVLASFVVLRKLNRPAPDGIGTANAQPRA